LGIASEIGAGKTTVGEYIKKKHNGKAFKFSEPLRDILKRLNLEETRANVQNLSTALRETFGQQLLSSVLLLDIKKSDSQVIIIDGIRRLEDIEFFKNLPEFLLIYIEAPERMRFGRIVGRGENFGDSTKTFEQFQKDNQAETELMIHKLKDVAKEVIDNSGTPEDLYARIDAVIGNFFKKPN